MRIDEITINIPITIDLDGDNPRVNVAGKDATDDNNAVYKNSQIINKISSSDDVDQDSDSDNDLDQNPIMMNPLQQELELKKAEQGKNSPVIDKMLDDENVGDEEDTDQEDNLDNLKTLAGLSNKIDR
jgi:hypothetical protein